MAAIVTVAVRWLVAPLSILATWLVLITAAIAVGLGVRKLLTGARELSSDWWFEAFWLGIAVTILATQLWHFFFPVNAVLAVFLLSLGMVGLAQHRQTLTAWWQRHGSLKQRPIAVALALGFWLANRALAAGASFDTDMYHVPAVEWSRAFPVVPGLANLHGRFGFNNANFLFAALLESGPWTDGSIYLLNGLLILPLLMRVVVRAFEWQHAAGAVRAPYLFDLMLLAPLIGIASHPVLFSSLSPDVAATAALFAAFSILVGAAFTQDANSRNAAIAVATVTLVLSATFKVSTVLVIGPLVPLALVLWLRKRSARELLPRKTSIVVGAICLGLAGTWLARGAILSGYPLYPSTFAGIPVDWRVPAEQPAAEAAWIRFFAQTYFSPAAFTVGKVQEYHWSDPSWLRPWVRALIDEPPWWQVLLPAAVLIVCLIWLRPRRWLRVNGQASVFSIVGAAATVALVAWFYFAPRPHFAFGFFWLAAAAAAAQLLLVKRWEGRRIRLARLMAIGLGVLPLVVGVLTSALRTSGARGQAAFTRVFITPEPDSWLQPTRFEYPITTFVTQSGLELKVPVGHRCDRAPQPCTSHPASNVRLRKPGDLARGFTTDGVWRPQRWPNPWSTRFLKNWRLTTGRAQSSNL